MKYEGMIYRPPSEAHSLILQVTIGCSHNKCAFCGSFKDKKFRVRSLEEIRQDVEEAREYERYVKNASSWLTAMRSSSPRSGSPHRRPRQEELLQARAHRGIRQRQVHLEEIG